MRDRDRRGSAASDWAEAQSGLPDWGVRGAWDLGAHNPTPDLELWSRRGMIKQPFGGVVRDIAPEGDGRGTILEVGGEVFRSGTSVVEQESPVVVGQPFLRFRAPSEPLRVLTGVGRG